VTEAARAHHEVFAWRVSRLNLQLNPLHPDRAGGLAFLTHTVRGVLKLPSDPA